MHFGTLLRILRTDAGLSLRQLASTLEVSSAYLSRVEHGHDATPTPDRLVAIARALGVAPTLLLELGHNAGPAVASYVQRVPAAGALFLEIADRELGPSEIARLRAFIDDAFPRDEAKHRRPPRVGDLLAPDRVVLRLAVTDWDDVLDIAAARLGPAGGVPVRRVREALAAREREAPSSVGGGLAIPQAVVPGARPVAARLVLDRPLTSPTPDAKPLRLALAFLLGAPMPELLARRATRRAPDELTGLTDPIECLARLAQFERS